MVEQEPLCIRQPDAFVISHERLQAAGGPRSPDPLDVAPEVVIEVTSDRESCEDLCRKNHDLSGLGRRRPGWPVVCEVGRLRSLRSRYALGEPPAPRRHLDRDYGGPTVHTPELVRRSISGSDAP